MNLVILIKLEFKNWNYIQFGVKSQRRFHKIVHS